MRVEKHIRRWLDEGIIDSPTAARLLEHESNRRGISFGNVLIGLAGLCIFLGIAAVIVANWANISGGAKIGAHTVLNGIIAIGLYYLFRAGKNKTIWFELLVALLAALTLTFIALIGQVFQTQEPSWKALALWIALVTPFWLWLGESKKLVNLWILAFLGFYQDFAVHFSLEGKDVVFTSTLLMSLLPFGMIALGQAPVFRKFRPMAAAQIAKAGFLLLVVGVSLMQIFWHSDRVPFDDTIQMTILSVFCAATGIVALRKFGGLAAVPPVLDVLILKSAIIAPLPFLIPHQGYPVIEAFINILYWGFCGWAGLKAGYPRMLTLMAVFMALRLIVVYVEVFGSLLETGFGLIISGFLLIAFVWGTRKALAHIGILHKEKTI